MPSILRNFVLIIVVVLQGITVGSDLKIWYQEPAENCYLWAYDIKPCQNSICLN